MEKTILNIGGRTCVLYEQEQPEFLLVQPVDEHDLKTLDDETEAIEALSNRSAVLVVLTINDWQHELSPWATPPVFGKNLLATVHCLQLVVTICSAYNCCWVAILSPDCSPCGRAITVRVSKVLLLRRLPYGSRSGTPTFQPV